MKLARVFGLVALLGMLAISCSNNSSPQLAGDDLRSFLPGKNAISGLTLQDSTKLFPRNTVWDHLSAIAEIYLNNGLDKLATGTYASGAVRIQVDLMSFRTPLDAFTMFTYHRASPTRSLEIPQAGYLLADTLGFLKGSYVGRLVRSGSATDDQMIAAARMIAEKISDTTSLPAELAMFPPENLIPHTETHWIRDQQQREEPFDFYGAQYLINGDTLTLYFRLYSVVGLPTATEAFIGERGQAEEMLLMGSSQGLFGKHPDFGNVFCAVNQGTLAVVTGYSERKTAQALAESFFKSVKTN